MHLTFACYPEYHELVKSHPYLDDVIDSKAINKDEFGISYDISKCCILYESAKSPQVDMPRVDIWAKHCGIEMLDHDMQVPFIDNDYLINAQLALKQLRQMSFSLYNKNGPSVLLAPHAYELVRSLLPEQIQALVSMLRKKGLFVYALHKNEDSLLTSLNVPVVVGGNFSEWMAYIHAADYVVSVDTSTFHYAGGIGKPLTGIFTSVDGKLRGKYYNFVLVQKHRDDGSWPCGPCYAHSRCTNPRCKNPDEYFDTKPCLTELTIKEMEEGVDKMLSKWAI